MSTIRRNILSNIAGSLWIISLTAIIVPIQIKYLGVEAYGLVGLLATLQMIFSVFDLGLSLTITRSIASDHSDNKSKSTSIVRTATSFYWAMGIVIGILVLSFSNEIAFKWFNESELNKNVLLKSIYIIGICVAFRWPVALYTGILSGLQRQDILNIIKSVSVSIRLVGGIIIIIAFKELVIFLYWIAFSALLEVSLYYYICKSHTPQNYLKPGFEAKVIREVWRFAIAMNVITILSMILINFDRILISKLLTLETLGYYYLAYNVAIGLSLIQSAVNNALYPSFTEDFSKNDYKRLNNNYSNATQVIVYLISLPAFMMICYGYEGLSIWVGVEAAEASSLTLSILALGFLITAIVSNSYIATIAFGRPNIIVYVNIIALLLYMPVMYYMVLENGIIGAALTWLGLNIYYLLVQVPVVHKKILKIHYLKWLIRNVLPFIVVAIICFAGSKVFYNQMFPVYEFIDVAVIILIMSLIYLFVGFQLLSDNNKQHMKELIANSYSLISKVK